jgi:hypothetical protein
LGPESEHRPGGKGAKNERKVGKITLPAQIGADIAKNGPAVQRRPPALYRPFIGAISAVFSLQNQ